MIYPTDYRQRVEKQHKTRLYKAMLDDQIRQNNYYTNSEYRNYNNQINKQRYKSQPHQNYNQSSQLVHQSKFLPNVRFSKNILDHDYKYIPSHDLTRLNLNQYSDGKRYQTTKRIRQRHNDQTQNDIDRCLNQCDSLINNIKKSYIKINRSNPKATYTGSNNKKNLQSIHGNFVQKSHLNSRCIRNSIHNDDIGRNQMMNYNLSKSRGNIPLTPATTKNTIGKGKFNNDRNNQRAKSQLCQCNDQIEKEIQRRQMQRKKAHQQLTKRDKSILEHLRRAKTRGGLLFKKIQMFKKQTQELQKNLQLDETALNNNQDPLNKSIDSRNTKSPEAIRNTKSPQLSTNKSLNQSMFIGSDSSPKKS